MELFTDDFVKAVKLSVELPNNMDGDSRLKVIEKLIALVRFGFKLPKVAYQYGLQDWLYEGEGQYLCFNTDTITIEESNINIREVSFTDFLDKFTLQMLIGNEHCLAICGNRGFYQLISQTRPSELTSFMLCNSYGNITIPTRITSKYNVYLKNNRKIGIKSIKSIPELIRKKPWFIELFPEEKPKNNIVSYNPEDDILTLETE